MIVLKKKAGLVRCCSLRTRCHLLSQGQGEPGMILIGMIVVLFLISSLVVAMMSQSTSTAFSLAYENSANRAYYLAESGFRYAAARIKHGADMKSDLHLHTPFSLANSAGSFDLWLFPHYLETDAAISGTTLSGIELPGGYDSGSSDALAFPGGSVKKVRIVAPDGTWDTIHDYSTASLTPPQEPTPGKYTTTVTFTGISPSISQTLPAGTVILPVAAVDGDQTTVGNDDGSGGAIALDIQAGSTAAFPQHNGTFRIDGDEVLYSYEKKDGDTLTGIAAPLDPTLSPPFSFDDGDQIVLERFVRIKSVGTYRNASRTVTFHMPISQSEATEVFEDRFDPTLSNWETPSQGTFQAPGGKLEVDTVATTAKASTKAAQIQLKTGTAIGESLKNAWQYGRAGYLSYDAQVKVGFDTMPDDYMAGLSFRVSDTDTDAEKKQYGISFFRADETSSLISNRLIPEKNSVFQKGKELLVLWQQTDDQEDDLTWLAYKDMNPAFYSDKMETPWTDNRSSLYSNEKQISWLTLSFSPGVWQIDDDGVAAPNTNHYWHDSPGGNYGNNFRLMLLTESMDLSNTKKAYLTFNHKYNLETNYDYGQIYININNSGLKLLRYFTGALPLWHTVEIDISSYLPASSVTIYFYLYTDLTITRDGWYIDNVAIRKKIPVQESTLVTRVQEAPVVVFSSGLDADGNGFKDGDSIYENDDGRLFGVIDGDPIITSGTWTAGTAAGLLALRNVDYDDSLSGTSLRVIGGSTTAALAAYGERENLIRAFIGDKTGEGTANATATDYLKKAHPRGTIKWPPEAVSNWSSDQDYFTLVQWDGVNETGTDGGGNRLYLPWSSVIGGTSLGGGSDPATFSLISTIDEPDAIIRTNALVSPGKDETYNHSELGLHAFGDGAQSTYFDDFGVRLSIGAQYQFPPVVQE